MWQTLLLQDETRRQHHSYNNDREVSRTVCPCDLPVNSNRRSVSVKDDHGLMSDCSVKLLLISAQKNKDRWLYLTVSHPIPCGSSSSERQSIRILWITSPSLIIGHWSKHQWAESSRTKPDGSVLKALLCSSVWGRGQFGLLPQQQWSPFLPHSSCPSVWLQIYLDVGSCALHLHEETCRCGKHGEAAWDSAKSHWNGYRYVQVQQHT